jgi:hypothetical protein
MTVDSPAAKATSVPGRLGSYLAAAGVVVYALLAFARPGEWGGLPAAVLAAAVLYPLSIYVYYGLARMTYLNQLPLLSVTAVIAIALSALMASSSSAWQVVFNWVLVLGGGCMAGWQLRRGYTFGRVFRNTAIYLVIVGAILWYPVWSQTVGQAALTVEAMAPDIEGALRTLGVQENAVGAQVDDLKRFLVLMIELSPATMIINILVQFGIGFAFFAWWASRHHAHLRLSPFRMWKAPFGLTPVLVVAVALRFLGGDILRIVADNTLLVLSVIYCLTGLAVCEYYLRKFGFGTAMRVLFYIALFLSQFVGYIVVALIGFADSFRDWRKVQLAHL